MLHLTLPHGLTLLILTSSHQRTHLLCCCLVLLQEHSRFWFMSGSFLMSVMDDGLFFVGPHNALCIALWIPADPGRLQKKWLWVWGSRSMTDIYESCVWVELMGAIVQLLHPSPTLHLFDTSCCWVGGFTVGFVHQRWTWEQLNVK